MKNIIFIASLFFASLFCKAQQVPIETDWDNVTPGMHLKDFNNKFNKYVGSWLATVGNKQVKLIIEKKMDWPILNYYSDALLMRYEVKINGQIVESTLGQTDSNVNIDSTGPSYYDNEVRFDNDGLLCRVGSGSIYLTYIDATHLEWSFYVETADLSFCPDPAAQTIDINLPYEPNNIIFTKQ